MPSTRFPGLYSSIFVSSGGGEITAVYIGPTGYNPATSGSSSTGFELAKEVEIKLEISWPAEISYSERKKKYHRYTVFFPATEG